MSVLILPEDKPAARAQVRAARRARRADLATDGAALAAAYRDGLLQHLAGFEPGTITAYESWATEPPTEVLISALQDAGWRVIVPDTLADLRLSWHDVTRPDVDLGIGGVEAADVALIPGLAIDLDGYRLGQGGGCYDRTLGLLRPGVPVIAMIFPDELVASVPRETHDARVDGVLTSEGVRMRDRGTGRIAP